MIVNYKNELNREQYDAVTTTEGPLLILAGAGSGKTRTLIYRVSYLIEMGVSPNQILLLTFTNKAANEMKERAKKMLDDRCSKIVACTYHSFCVKLLRKYYAFVELSDNFTIIDTGDCADVFSMLKAEKNYHKIKGFPPSSVLVSVISSCLNQNKTLFDVMNKKYKKYMSFIPQIGELARLYKEYKSQNNIVDYDDLLVLTLKLLKTYPAIRERIENTYKYIMQDEYQDSNYLQEQIVFYMRQNNKNIAVVGDDAQSIYGFRGSNVRNIITFPDKWDGCKVVYLTKNYRSNQEILDLSNNVMSSNMTEGIPKEMIGTHHKKLKPEIICVDDTIHEARYVVNKIVESHKNGEEYKNMCILVRNAFQSFLIESSLTSLGIDYDKYGGIKFLEKEHVKDLLAYLRCAVNAKDEIAWYRVLQLHEGIGKVYARNIAAECKEAGNFALLNPKYSKKKYANELTMLYNHVTSLLDDDLESSIKNAIEFYYNLKVETITNMKTESEEKRDELFVENERHKKELFSLISMSDGYTNVLEFLDDLSLDNKKDGDSDKLIISTIHSAKGLEYKTVFILDCIDEVCPSTSKDEAGSEEDNEELRCFYVAMTRAKENLYMIVPEVMSKYGQVFPGKMSHFLEGHNELYNINYI